MIAIVDRYQANNIHDDAWMERYLNRRDLTNVMLSGMGHISSHEFGFEYLAYDYTSEFNSDMMSISNCTDSFDDLNEDNDSFPSLSGISDYRYTSGFRSYNMIQRFRYNFYSMCDNSLLNF